MRILLDECVPKPIIQALDGMTVLTAQSMGWATKKNGDLISLAEQSFDLLITSDQNMQYQQNLQGRNIAILLLPTNRWPILSLHLDEIRDVVLQMKPKAFMELTFEM
jgi:hypothetical protein